MTLLSLHLLLCPLLAVEASPDPARLVLHIGMLDLAAAPPPTDFDFQLLPEHKLTTEEMAEADAIARSAALRRKVLEIHQAFGITTAVLLAATVVVGQLSYSDKFGGANTGQYELAHGWLEAGATLSFVTTGLLALLAPVPIEKHTRAGFDSITVHKWSMLVATAGFAAQIVLGILTVSLEGRLNQQDFAIAHLIVGYTTTAAFGAGFAALALP